MELYPLLQRALREKNGYIKIHALDKFLRRIKNT